MIGHNENYLLRFVSSVCELWVTPGDRTTHRESSRVHSQRERILRSEAAVDEGPDLRLARGQSNMWYISAWSLLKDEGKKSSHQRNHITPVKV